VLEVGSRPDFPRGWNLPDADIDVARLMAQDRQDILIEVDQDRLEHVALEFREVLIAFLSVATNPLSDDRIERRRRRQHD
jgi:hypothetical protein